MGCSRRALKQAAPVVFSALVAAFSGVACTDDSTEYRGRVFLAPVRAETGVTVGLAIDYLPASSSNQALDLVEVEVQATGVVFTEGGSGRFCLRLPSSGRRGLLADASG